MSLSVRSQQPHALLFHFILTATENFDLGAFHFFASPPEPQKNTESSSPKLNFLQGFAVELFLWSPLFWRRAR
jgi:hypothetical protein